MLFWIRTDGEHERILGNLGLTPVQPPTQYGPDGVEWIVDLNDQDLAAMDAFWGTLIWGPYKEKSNG